MAWLLWLGGALLLAVVETLTVDFTFLMLAGGALGGALTALLGGPFWLQVLVSVVIATLLLIAVRPWARRRIQATAPDMKTNAEALVGRAATALTAVDARGGRVQISGAEWSARLAPAAVGSTPSVSPGSEMQVVAIEGATAVVAPKMPNLAGAQAPQGC
ncbi:NfeD-like C-terminal, partner-binding [Actinomyces bovis]|uniref:NfeD-like C-terminal, partner-binding n=1 Tax=Actinomyces bovis TaxID=1658 RepID=A0ABY1VK43_9ACTO|nr:NfeD family protein [Actinomyces bovis]SPT52469.1 NfeD-like C-terminal, partner-binding [Actinomyces bovis]VEG54150.1 NfeD-like C-terminal, partner-binding [Actinomyces israelii]